jgi:hypothetical protein
MDGHPCATRMPAAPEATVPACRAPRRPAAATPRGRQRSAARA